MKSNFLKIIIIIIILSTMTSGCIEEEINSSELKIVSLKDLGDNCNNYIGKNITTQGFIKNGKGENISQLYVISLCDTNSSNPDYCCLLYVPTDVIIYSGYYQISGIVGAQINLTIPKIDVFSAKLLS